MERIQKLKQLNESADAQALKPSCINSFLNQKQQNVQRGDSSTYQPGVRPECPLSLEKISRKDLYVADCLHCFNKESIQQWVEVQKKLTCPICRKHTVGFEVDGECYLGNRHLNYFSSSREKEFGGWVAHTARVGAQVILQRDAMVYGNARVSGNALIMDRSKIYGNAKVGGSANTYDDARIFDNATLKGTAQIADNAKVYGTAVVSSSSLFDDAEVCGHASVEGDSEIQDNAKVYGNARVSLGSVVKANAHVFGHAHIRRGAEVMGNARVGGEAKIFGQIEVGGDISISRDVKLKNFGNVIKILTPAQMRQALSTIS
jgi:carbonic anhydrase/acetyltransferase-like protein (isoleucine patch superfamily)